MDWCFNRFQLVLVIIHSKNGIAISEGECNNLINIIIFYKTFKSIEML
jgi:predicted type IV restriction endonuclease